MIVGSFTIFNNELNDVIFDKSWWFESEHMIRIIRSILGFSYPTEQGKHDPGTNDPDLRSDQRW